MAWDRIPVVLSLVDTVTDLLNNQSLSYTFETADFEKELKSIDTLLTKVEKLFSGLSLEEQKVGDVDTVEQQRRRNLVEHVAKLKLRAASFNMAVAVCFVSFYSTQDVKA